MVMPCAVLRHGINTAYSVQYVEFKLMAAKQVAASVPVVAAAPSIKAPIPALQIPAGQPSTQAVQLEPLKKPDEPKAAAPTRVLRLANMVNSILLHPWLTVIEDLSKVNKQPSIIGMS